MEYAGSALNVYDTPVFSVLMTDPLPTEAITTLVTIQWLILYETTNCMYIRAAPEPSIPGWEGAVMVDGDDPANLIALGNSTGYYNDGWPLPAAAINDMDWCFPLAVNNSTWGAMKALYR